MARNTSGVKSHILEQFSLIGKALSCAARLEIIDLLCQTERTVEGLAREASLSVANTSQHLQVLRQAGLVASRREKNFIVYRIASDDVFRLWQTVQSVGRRQLAEIDQTVARYFHEKDELHVLDLDDTLRRAKAGEILLLDVRPEEEYRYAHLPGARSVPLRDLKKRLGDLPEGKTIVAYCRGPYCVLSQEAVNVLRKKGLEAYRIPDGVREWKARELPHPVGKRRK